MVVYGGKNMLGDCHGRAFFDIPETGRINRKQILLWEEGLKTYKGLEMTECVIQNIIEMEGEDDN